MNIKSQINQLQKQLLDRLNVRKGSTLFTIIQEISRQAFAKSSFVVSQKNATLAKKCCVTASTISRNLKKIKEKCADIIEIEQNRNNEEKFAALVFTFIPQETSNGMSNGEQTEDINTGAESIEMAENTSSLSINPLVYSTNINNINNVIHVKQDAHEQEIFDMYIEFKQQHGIDKTLFDKVVSEVRNKRNVMNFKAYLRGALNNVINHIDMRKRTNDLTAFYNEINEQSCSTKRPQFYNWLESR